MGHLLLALKALFFPILSISNRAMAAPTARDLETTIISQAEYESYLRTYYPNTHQYIQYSGNSFDQVRVFQAENPDYKSFFDFFDPYTSLHFLEAFPPGQERFTDLEAASRAISNVATESITVFGAIESSARKGRKTFYSKHGAPALEEGVRSGRLKAINHMVKGAKMPTQVMAVDCGSITYQRGYGPDTPNASGLSAARPHRNIKRQTMACGPIVDPDSVPPLERKGFGDRLKKVVEKLAKVYGMDQGKFDEMPPTEIQLLTKPKSTSTTTTTHPPPGDSYSTVSHAETLDDHGLPDLPGRFPV